VAVLLLGVTLGLDSFRACVGLAALSASRRLHVCLALAFGLFDGLGSLIGIALGGSVMRSSLAAPAAHLGPGLLIGYGTLLIAVRRSTPSRVRDLGQRCVILGMPVALSLDNLVSGAALGLVQFPPVTTAVVIGVASGIMALVGLRFGAIVVRRLSLQSELAVGVMLLLAGVILAAH
jgi:putative Mn2+ efflux pump MntP